jgi:FkbM family methyltransferase
MSFAQKVVGMVPAGLIQKVSANQWRHPLLRRVCKFGADLLRNNDGVIQNGIGRGLKFNPGRSHSGFILGTHKPEVQKLFASFLGPGMHMFDAGANVGYYATLCAGLVGPSGSVICFEPLPENVRQIEHNASLNGFSHMKVRNEALGAEDGSAVFFQSAEPTWGKLQSTGRLPDQYVGEIEVKVRKLDSVMAEARFPNPDLIKIDVEGAEEALLQGAERTITEARPVLVIELHGTNAEIASALERFGYEATVLGREESVVNSPWNSLVVAAPRERADRLALLRTSELKKGVAAG